MDKKVSQVILKTFLKVMFIMLAAVAAVAVLMGGLVFIFAFFRRFAPVLMIGGLIIGLIWSYGQEEPKEEESSSTKG